MCGRFVLTAEARDILAEFGIEPPPDYRPRYNIAPTQPVLAITDSSDGWRAGQLLWGADRHMNARAETVATRPAFRAAFARRRCLIPADGFLEWQGEGKHRRPMLIRRRDGRPFAFAGIWGAVGAADGAPVYSCTILTTEPNALVRPIHDRMPVMLTRRQQERWLDPAAPQSELIELLRPFDPSALEAFAVSTLVNSPKNDVPECVAPL